MHGERDGRPGSSPSPSMMADENSKSDTNATSSNMSSAQSQSTELAYLPIGCSVSAKYRGAFCSAQVKAIEKQVKLKVTLSDSGDTITVSEEQIVQPAQLRIGHSVTVRLNSSNRRQSNDSNTQSHYSRSGLAAFINNNNPDEKQAMIKQIVDNSIYTVVFDDGDEKSLRRSSLCLQGVRLYQNQYGQQKILEEVPSSSTINVQSGSSTSPPPSSVPNNDATHTNANDSSSVVAIKRKGSSDQQVFPALVLKRKALADYMWVRSFVDGREYIVHTRDDVQRFHDNPEIQALCREAFKQATLACEKFIKFNHIPAVWQKRKKKQKQDDDKDDSSDEENSSENDSGSEESDDDESDDDDDDDIDEATAEEKDSFVAQLLTFMDDRGTPINNIPKVQNYDLDLHRLFKIVRMFGGYNKVTKNHQWDQVHIKMGLPDDPSSVNGRAVESAYKKYLFAYEDLSKKLGSMNAPSAYLGGRTSLGSDSRRSLIRVRQQQQQLEEKNNEKQKKIKSSPAATKQKANKFAESRPSSADSKGTSSSAKKVPPKPTPKPVRKVPTKTKPSNVISSSSSESESESDSETSDEDDDDDDDDDSSKSSSSGYERTPKAKTKPVVPSSASKKKSVPATPVVQKKSTTVTATSKIETKKNTTSTTSTPTAKSSTVASTESKHAPSSVKLANSMKSKISSPVHTVKKPPPSTASSADDKKKLASVKSDHKVLSTTSPKKTNTQPVKTPQSIKTTATNKPINNDSSKSTSSASNKTSSIPTALSFKPKPTQITQASNNQNKDRSVSKSTASSTSADARPVKSQKPTPPTNKTQTGERPQSVPIRKPKPIVKIETPNKLPTSTTMKIPKISSSSDTLKKSSVTVDKTPKKTVSKEGTIKSSNNQEQTNSQQISKSTSEISNKSPSRATSVIESSEKVAVRRDTSPITESTASPITALSCTSSISEETNVSNSATNSLNTLPSVTSSHQNTPEHKPIEAPLIFQPIPTTPKEAQEEEPQPGSSLKRQFADESTEQLNTSTVTLDPNEQLSPLKRARTSISSQESLDTLSSNDHQTHIESSIATRNAHLTYEDIAINDVLLVTWGSNGIKSYPARCIAKNDEKLELYVHYIKYNPRHDEWIKLDRVLERTESNVGNIPVLPKIRRTTNISGVRQQHTDSTSSNASTIGNQSNEQIQTPAQTPPNTISSEINASSGAHGDGYLKQHTSSSLRSDRSNSNDRSKYLPVDISDSDENSQENPRCSPILEPISSTEEDTPPSTVNYTMASTDNKPNNVDETPSRRTSLSGMNTVSSTLNEDISTETQKPEIPMADDDGNDTTNVQENKFPQRIIDQRRLSIGLSHQTKIEPVSTITSENNESNISSDSHTMEHIGAVKEDKMESPIINICVETPTPVILKTEPISNSISYMQSTASASVVHRRGHIRQPKKRTLREPHGSKDSSIAASSKKKTKIEIGNNHSNEGSIDSNLNNDQLSTRSSSTEQQINESGTGKRHRPVGRRGNKRAANLQDHENDECRSNSPSSVTMRQQLKDMFKHRTSRYNFLDLNNTLTGDERIGHLKDKMRDCQKVFFNLKSALVKIEKQRKVFLRKQKSLLQLTTPTTSTMVPNANSELLSTASCT